MISIVTSIAPFNLDNQKLAIQSWSRAGFEVISINVKEEIGQLAKEFKAVNFIEAEADARLKHKKPLIYLSEALNVLKLLGKEVCGVMNADIFFSVRDFSAFNDFVCENASKCLVYGSRVDISTFDDLNGSEYLKGFDYFFFDKAIIDLFSVEEFCFGVPWWDYWFPLVPHLHGKRIKRIVSPVAFHVMHGDRWSQQAFYEYGDLFKKIVETNQEGGARPILTAILERASDSVQFADAVCEYLHYVSEDIYFYFTDEHIQAAPISQSQHSQMLSQLKRHSELGLLHGLSIADVTRELQRCKNELMEIQNSFSWRTINLVEKILLQVIPSLFRERKKRNNT